MSRTRRESATLLLLSVLTLGCGKGGDANYGDGPAKASGDDGATLRVPKPWVPVSVFAEPAAAFRHLDSHHNGYLDLAEFTLDCENLSGRQKMTNVFGRCDGNRDKKVLLDEFQSSAAQSFFLCEDEDRDGFVSLKELYAAELNGRSFNVARRIFCLVDRNCDGKLSLEEFSGRPIEEWFLKLDTDENERLSLAEFTKGYPHLVANGRSERAFAACDINGDGVLDLREFAHGPSEAEVVLLDEDGDGKLSLVEYTAGASTPEEVVAKKNTFEHKDTDQDGLLSMREYSSDPAGDENAAKGP